MQDPETEAEDGRVVEELDGDPEANGLIGEELEPDDDVANIDFDSFEVEPDDESGD